MSDQIELKGSPELVDRTARWLRGEDVLDYNRRKPTTSAETEACFVRYKALTLANLNADAQFDHDQEKREGWSV